MYVIYVMYVMHVLCTYTCLYACHMYVCMYVCMLYVCNMYVCMYVCVYAGMHVCCMFVDVCMHLRPKCVCMMGGWTDGWMCVYCSWRLWACSVEDGL